MSPTFRNKRTLPLDINYLLFIQMVVSFLRHCQDAAVYVLARAANDPSIFTITETEMAPARPLLAFNQEKALVGAFSVIIKTDGSFAALVLAQTESPNSLISSQCLSLPNSKLL